MEVKQGRPRNKATFRLSCSAVLWLVLVWSRYGYFLTVSLENHWHKTPIAGIPSLVSTDTVCSFPTELDHSRQTALVGVDAPGSSMLFKTLKCGLRCYFHRYIKEQSPSIYLLLDHQLDGWMLIVSLWTLIWLIAYYGELNLLNVCKF